MSDERNTQVEAEALAIAAAKKRASTGEIIAADPVRAFLGPLATDNYRQRMKQAWDADGVVNTLGHGTEAVAAFPVDYAAQTFDDVFRFMMPPGVDGPLGSMVAEPGTPRFSEGLPTGAPPLSPQIGTSQKQAANKGTSGAGQSGSTLLDSMVPITIQMESGGNSDAVSSAGALGLMQIMPATGKSPGYGIKPWTGEKDDNQRFGTEYLQAMLTEFNGDPAMAWAAYNAGPGKVKEALKKGGANGWLSFLPGETQSYVQKGMAQLGGGTAPAFVNPFDPKYHQAALSQIDKAEQAALQPFSVTRDIGQAPAFPELQKPASRDFSEEDAILEQLKPQMISEKEQKSIEIKNWMQGMGQALAAMPEGAGLGKVLALAGAGSLMGRAAGMGEVQERMDKFQEQMAQYNVLRMQQAGRKSDQAYQEATAEVNAMNQWNVQKFQVDMQKFQREAGTIQKQGDSFVTTKEVTDADGNTKRVTNVIPIEPAIRSAAAFQRAAVMGQIGNMNFQGAAMQGRAINGYATSVALSGAASGEMSQEESLVQGVGMMSYGIVQGGMLDAILGAEGSATLHSQLDEQLAAEGYLPGTAEAQERKMSLLTSEVAATAIAEPAMLQRMMQMQPQIQASIAAERFAGQQTRTRTNSKGESTTTVTR